MTAHMLTFTGYTKLFLLETDASKDRLRNRQTDDITLLPIVAEPLPLIGRITTQPSLSLWH